MFRCVADLVKLWSYYIIKLDISHIFTHYIVKFCRDGHLRSVLTFIWKHCTICVVIRTAWWSKAVKNIRVDCYQMMASIVLSSPVCWGVTKTYHSWEALLCILYKLYKFDKQRTKVENRMLVVLCFPHFLGPLSPPPPPPPSHCV